MTKTKTRGWMFAVALAWSVGLVACGDDATRDADDDDGGGATDSEGDTGSDSGGEGCAEEAKKIYLVDTDNGFWRFDPATKQLELVGTIACASGGSPFSMAVSREGIAYVLYYDGGCVAINAVSILDASCSGETAFDCGNAAGFDLFGMGFATDGPETTAERLYVANGSSLGWIDVDAGFAVEAIGSITGDPELTGNANGELWGFFPTAATVHVSRINKETGLIELTYDLPSLSNSPAAWAFAHWGGDYYIFYESGTDASTNIWLVDGASGELSSFVPNTGKHIVGAGVSTCAPVDVQ